MSLTREQRTINERTTARYTALAVDETEEPIPASSLSTLTLTLYDKASGEIINGRQAQDALNANGVSVDESGNVEWIITPDDTPVVGTPRPGLVETHIALFEWTWAGGTKAGKHELELLVKQIAKVS